MKFETISEAVKFLESAFDSLNIRFFESALSRPMITVQSSTKAYGHFTQFDAWAIEKGEKAEGRKEINLGAETLNRPIENVIATLVHEMVHYYCLINEIKDTSRGGTYHNKAFKQAAEAHGLIIAYDKRIGWSLTQPSESLKAFVKDQGWDKITIVRQTPEEGSEKKKSSTRKYVCPECGAIVRATKQVNVICGDCMVQMEQEEE